MSNLLQRFRSELRRTLFNDSVNLFYFFSMIIWPIISFVQVNYNLRVFPLATIKITGISTEQTLFYFIFIGYSAYILFQNVTQSCWRLGEERTQGTLSQIFMAPVNKLAWLYSRSFAMLWSNTWFFVLIFIFGNFWFMSISGQHLGLIVLSLFLLVLATWIWGAFISVFFIILRDGTVLFVFLEGPQDTFSGIQVPLAISPRLVRMIGSIFPLSYSVTLLRCILLKHQILSNTFVIFVGINLFLIVVTVITLKKGERHMRVSGNFDLY